MKQAKIFLLITLLFHFNESVFGNPVDQSSKRIVIAKGGLRMREAPDAKGKLLIIIPENSEVILLEEKGEEIEISNTKGKWTNIKFKNHSGWVFGGFLKSNTNNHIENIMPVTPLANCAGCQNEPFGMLWFSEKDKLRGFCGVYPPIISGSKTILIEGRFSWKKESNDVYKITFEGNFDEAIQDDNNAPVKISNEIRKLIFQYNAGKGEFIFKSPNNHCFPTGDYKEQSMQYYEHYFNARSTMFK